jgi:DNA mismatch repair ATPase MutS
LVDDSQVSVLCFQVGDFYEAIGIDACILVEYAGLNPFGGLRSDSVPRAGCPVVVLDLHPSFVIVDFLDLECL